MLFLRLTDEESELSLSDDSTSPCVSSRFSYFALAAIMSGKVWKIPGTHSEFRILSLSLRMMLIRRRQLLCYLMLNWQTVLFECATDNLAALIVLPLLRWL
jgi:hypothetical protein